MTNIKCGSCSSFQSPVYHDSIAAVRECFETRYAAKTEAPKVELPSSPAAIVVLTAPVEPKVIDYAPKSFNRFSAACPKKGCKTHAVKDHYFVLKCSNHGYPVWTKAKQLVGQLSTSDKHRCNDACMFATGPVCTCSCSGANHGLGYLIKLEAAV
mgnify:CR=1 FL=1